MVKNPNGYFNGKYRALTSAIQVVWQQTYQKAKADDVCSETLPCK